MRTQSIRRRRLPIVFATFVLAVASACSSGVTVDPLRPEEVAMMESAGNFPSGDYRVEPGDTIEIIYPYHPEMKQLEQVRPDGRISAKVAGDVDVGGLTTAEVEERLRELTSETLRDPEVEVLIASFAPRGIYVTGEVRKPGLIEYRRGLTPLQAVADAGGFLSTALLDQVVLIRASHDNDAFLSRSLDLEAVVEEGVEQPLTLAPRDVIYVPKTRIANADLWVDQHVTRLFPFIRGTSTSFPLGF